VWVSIYSMEVLPIIKDMSPSFFPPLMPLVEALQPIAHSWGLHFVILAPPCFPCVISTFISIMLHLVRVFQVCELTIPSLHVQNMN
jgi:hypothetical protein